MKKQRESGFALLLVFLMAAAIAISLYIQIPRVAFQAQRQKEQLLIERGEQYKRAIQLFYHANNRYPGKIEDLENFNNRRFLRHRFIDPMTGKDDWRLVHVNNGVLTDSALTKNKATDPNQPQQAPAGPAYITEQAQVGATLNQPQPGQFNNVFNRRRPSEGGLAPQQLGPDGQPLPPADAQQPPPPPQPFPGAQQFPGAQPFPTGQPITGGPLPGTITTGGQPQPNPFGQQPVGGNGPNPNGPVPPELANLPGVNNFGQPNPGRTGGFGVQPPGQVTNPNAPPSSTYVGGSTYIGTGGSYIGGGSSPVSGGPPAGFSSGTGGGVSGGGGSYIGSSTYIGGGGSYIGGGGGVGQNNPGVPTNTGIGGQGPANPGFPQTSGPTQPIGQPASPVAPISPRPFPGAQPPANIGGFPGPTPGNAGFPQSSTPGQNPAADLINNIVRNPAPTQAGLQPGGQQIGGGIAGVASRSESASIMEYYDRTKYNEWEFVFDPAKQRAVTNPAQGGIGTPVANMGASPAGPGFGMNPAANAGIAAGPVANQGFGLSPGGAVGPGFGNNPAAGNGQNPPGAGAAAQPPIPPDIRLGRR